MSLVVLEREIVAWHSHAPVEFGRHITAPRSVHGLANWQTAHQADHNFVLLDLVEVLYSVDHHVWGVLAKTLEACGASFSSCFGFVPSVLPVAIAHDSDELRRDLVEDDVGHEQLS